MKECEIMGVKLYELDKFGPNGIRLYEVRETVFIQGIRVPKGYVTNGASIPKVLRNLISPTGSLFRAAVMHDYLYSTKCFSRKKSDGKFRKAIEATTGNWFLAHIAWMAVRAGGQKAWGPEPVGI